eukprot:2807348-Alexandrium_andersonii.AAC.1
MEPHPPQQKDAGAAAPATPQTAMNRLGWAQEQIEVRKALVDFGQLAERGGLSDDPSDEAYDGDAWGHFMAGEDGGADMDAEDDEAPAPLDSAPKRSRSGEKLAIPRRPKPAPCGPAAE